MRKMKKTEDDIKRLISNMKWIEGICKSSVHKVGIIRFNPFRDIGGKMLDYKDSGVVISSLHGKDGARMYAKPILKGKSKYQLTDEEEEAILKATG